MARIQDAYPRPPADEGPSEDPGGISIAELLAAARLGKEEAWREIIRRYGRRVFALARSRSRSAEVAEDITQSVFATLAAQLSRGGYAEVGRFESWLFRIAMNRVRDESRRLSRHATPTDPALFGDRVGPTTHGGATENDEMERLRGAIEELPDADREIVKLRHHAGLSFNQIAELLHEPLGTALARHHRALRKLKTILESGGRTQPQARGAKGA